MSNFFGDIQNPTAYTTGDQGQGLFTLISNILRLAGVVAGIFFVIQVILAGYAFISASGDPKKAEVALAKIWQSVIGLLIVSSAFVLAALLGRILGIDDILTPVIYGPNN
jgi:Type IV secretion system pilin